MRYIKTLLSILTLIFVSCSLFETEDSSKEDDIKFLNDLIELNDLTEDTTPFDNDNGDGIFTALELGWHQDWENGRLVYLDLHGYIPGYTDSSIYNIKVIPGSIINADKLGYIGIHHSDLSELPPEIVNHPSIWNLHLAANKIKEIPVDIYKMKNLEILALQMNEIESVPPSVANCPKLSNLDLSLNEINILPDEIWDIKNLKSLRVSSNLLTELPNRIDRIEEFEYLDFAWNSITELPEGFENITVKYGLQLHFNSLFCSNGQVDSALVPDYMFGTELIYSEPMGQNQVYMQNCDGQ